MNYREVTILATLALCMRANPEKYLRLVRSSSATATRMHGMWWQDNSLVSGPCGEYTVLLSIIQMKAVI